MNFFFLRTSINARSPTFSKVIRFFCKVVLSQCLTVRHCRFSECVFSIVDEVLLRIFITIFWIVYLYSFTFSFVSCCLTVFRYHFIIISNQIMYSYNVSLIILWILVFCWGLFRLANVRIPYRCINSCVSCINRNTGLVFFFFVRCTAQYFHFSYDF